MKNKNDNPEKEPIKVRITSNGSIKVVNEDVYFARIGEQIKEMKKRAAERAAVKAATESAETAAQNPLVGKAKSSDAGQSLEEKS